jgi:SAM-dependent methyltransferase
MYCQPNLLKRLDWIVRHVVSEQQRLGRFLRILDMGCGVGNVAMPIASLGHHVDAVDVSPENIWFASQRNCFQNLSYHCADVTSDSFPQLFAEKFDIIIASDVIEHVEEPEALVRNAIACGSEGAKFLFTTPNGYSQLEFLIFVLEKLRLLGAARKLKRAVLDRRKTLAEIAASGSINLGRGAPHVQHFTAGRLIRLFERHGLQVTEIANAGTVLAFGYLGPMVVIDRLMRIDLFLRELVPRWLAGGWYLALRRRHRD